MLPYKTIVYLLLFISAVLGGLFYHPMVVLSGYLISYHINPLSHWWGSYIPSTFERYSLILGFATLVSVIFHRSKLSYRHFWDRQEILFIMFLGLIWLSVPLGVESQGIDEHVIKMTKVIIMLLISSHIITTIKRYDIFVILFISTGLFLGVETYIAPASYFHAGRLDKGIGGGDLLNGNMLAAHFIVVLSFLGVMFLKKSYKIKILCFFAAAFILNGIILIRSRGSLLGIIAAGLASISLSKGARRAQILICLIAAMIGGAILVDPGFLHRMDEITIDSQQMDSSARSRLEVWDIALRMSKDYPLGVGVGNSSILNSRYNPSYGGLDIHNTYLRCLADMGFQGLALLLALILNAFFTLSNISRNLSQSPDVDAFWYQIFAVRIGLIGFLVTVTFVCATYTEDFYWLLMLPTFLKRAFENSLLQINGIYSNATVIPESTSPTLAQ